MRPCRGRRATDDLCLERDDPVRYGPQFLLDHKMVAVYESNYRIGCFLDTFDKIGIEVNFAFVESGELYQDTRLPKWFLFFMLPFGCC
jgi:hypothetical protein